MTLTTEIWTHRALTANQIKDSAQFSCWTYKFFRVSYGSKYEGLFAESQITHWGSPC